MKKIEIIVERTKSGYSTYASKYPVYTVGKSLEELETNIVAAINLYLEKDDKTVTEDKLKISLDRWFFDKALPNISLKQSVHLS